MRVTEICRAWVVYRMTLSKNAIGGNVVCEQREWEGIEANRPGYHTLLHSGIGTEEAAEKLARGTTGETMPLGDKKKTRVAPLFATVVPAPLGQGLNRRTHPPSASPPRHRNR